MALQLFSIQLKPLKNEVDVWDDRLLLHHRMNTAECHWLISWIFKYIAKLSREEDLLILKTEHCISRKWKSRARIKAVVRVFFPSFYKIRDAQFLKPRKPNKAKQNTHVQGLHQYFLISSLLSMLVFSKPKKSHPKEIPGRKPRP